MLSKADLAGMQATQNSVMDQTGSRVRISRTADGAGGWTETESTLAAISCTLGAPGNERERLIASRITQGAAWMLSAPVGTDILAGDFFIVAGMRLKVLHTEQAGSFATALRCYCEEVR